jgi:hypothetical protein
MSGWLRYFALKAQLQAGMSSGIVIWAVIALISAAAAFIFLLAAAFIWLADRYNGVIAGLVLGGFFLLLMLIAVAACAISRKRNVERARLELAARSNTTSWLDPALIATGLRIGQSIGWQRIAALAGAALLAAGVAKEWRGAREDPDETSDNA